MGKALRGKPVADALTEEVKARVAALEAKGVSPKLAILRVGERADDLSYERGATKRAEKCGVAVQNVVLPIDCSQDDLMAAIATMLRKFGLKDNEFAIGVSSRKLLATYLEEIGAPNPALVYPVLDRRLKIGPEAFAKALTEAGLSETQIKQLDDFMSCKSLEEVEQKLQGLGLGLKPNEE